MRLIQINKHEQYKYSWPIKDIKRHLFHIKYNINIKTNTLLRCGDSATTLGY